MTEYRIEFSEKLHKSIKQIPKHSIEKIMGKIESLAITPRPDDCKKLRGDQKPPLYRIRVGDYRVIYIIKDSMLLVLVIDIGHRKDIYKIT